MKKNIFYFIIVLFLSSNTMFSNFGSHGLVNAKSTLLGNAGSAFADGIYNINLNPASMISPTDSSYLQFYFPGLEFNAQAYTNAMALEDVNYYFGGVDGVGRYLTDDDKNNLIQNFEDNGQIGASVNLNLFSFGIYVNESVGAFGLSVTDHINFNTKVPQGLVDLALNGNVPANTYEFNDFTFTSSYVRSYALSYARKLLSNSEGIFKSINGGLSLKMYQGFGFSEVNMLSSSFYTHPNGYDLEMNYRASMISSYSPDLEGAFDNNDETDPEISPNPAGAGSGFGIDLGFSAELDMGLVIAASITDMGSFNWNENIQEKIFSAEVTITDLGDEDQLDTLENISQESIKTLDEYGGDLPTALRIGFWLPLHRVISMPGEMNISFDFHQGFNDYAANSSVSRVALGIDYKPWRYSPTFLTGFSNDRIGNLRWSFGLGINASFMDVYLGTHDLISAISPNDHASFAFGIRWKIY